MLISAYIRLDEKCAYLVPHQTLLVLNRARVPRLKVSLTAFAPVHRRKIEEDSSKVSPGCRVLPRELA